MHRDSVIINFHRIRHLLPVYWNEYIEYTFIVRFHFQKAKVECYTYELLFRFIIYNTVSNMPKRFRIPLNRQCYL